MKPHESHPKSMKFRLDIPHPGKLTAWLAKEGRWLLFRYGFSAACYDQGSEMALHQSLSKRLRMDIYFCDPHSPWQRGSNENANGLIREYLPKGMDLSQVSHQQLTAIEHSLNHRPRKILNFHSPHEVFSALTADFIRGVALQA